MNETVTTEQLVQLLDGELTGDTLAQVQQQLAANPAIQEEYEQLKAARQAIRLHGVSQKLKGLHQEMMQELTPVLPAGEAPVVRLFRPLLRIAAIVVLLAGATIVYQYYAVNPASVFDSQYNAYAIPAARSIKGPAALAEAFEQKNYQQVISLYKSLAAPGAEESFLAGNAYLQLNQATESVKAFEEVLTINARDHSFIYADETDYYLALAYLKTGAIREALERFEKIEKDPSHPYHQAIGRSLRWKLWLLRKKTF
jgi:tetratricopeptide (TPR) repeat protein